MSTAMKHAEVTGEVKKTTRPKFTVCIPAYNRARYMARLLDSIFAQNFESFDIAICEDCSSERAAISEVVDSYSRTYPGVISYYENETNLGYDGNIRKLVDKASGEFCFFMGNDDVMCPGALTHVADVLTRNPDVGFVLKSYLFSDQSAGHIAQEVRYFEEERRFSRGQEAILVCYRRSGVIAGYIIRRDAAHAAATNRFDGTLYYQMHLTAQVLSSWPAVSTPMVLVHCGGDEPPDFGNSGSEKGKYKPGVYTPQARLNMVQGALTIIRDLRFEGKDSLAEAVQRDYAYYFYPFIKDQLNLPIGQFLSLYRSYGRMGFVKYPIFHVYCAVAYLLGERRFDLLTKAVRKRLGRSPHFGSVGK
ncbi:glycosyltransferase family 2 protein [Granulicella sibirica]|uniref:Glycosyl transferase, group 2 family protein n=1 Tax=Granulicella sibirica TaxID=2479048 RepID=A0A4Q0T8F7_9BACT|nr:glycosyltransferase family A protein [Granulicella sibirica]RXH58438.1 glycosyl transferase, group 2 family protein [Granulicella sibirica]